MTFEYISDPRLIEENSFLCIRELLDLSPYTRQQQQVVMRVVHSLGIPSLASQLCFSENACEQGMIALGEEAKILCDVEMVKQGVSKRFITREPLCFLNDEKTRERAKNSGETRSMAALEMWVSKLAGSVVLIGNAPTALFRLLELIQGGAEKPALIIAMPVGFIGAAESKQALWDLHKKLGLECITMLGREGGSAVTAASCNALLRCNEGEYY